MAKSFWDYVVWVILILIVIYAFLKLTGVIQSFDWVVVIGASIVVGRYMQKIDTIRKDLEKVKSECPRCF